MTRAAGNPSLAETVQHGRGLVVGGVSPKPQILTMTPEAVAEEVQAALVETNGVRLAIGPGCSISPDAPTENLLAAKQAVDAWAAQSSN
jgi:uroporphyrinogen-III decarboxylase